MTHIYLKQINQYMHILTFKFPTIRLAQQLIKHSNFAFCIFVKDGYSHISIIKHHFLLFTFFWTIQSLSVETFAIWAGYSPTGFSLHLLNPYCSFTDGSACVLLFIWMISWS